MLRGSLLRCYKKLKKNIKVSKRLKAASLECVFEKNQFRFSAVLYVLVHFLHFWYVLEAISFDVIAKKRQFRYSSYANFQSGRNFNEINAQSLN